jgi:uncharacterized protein YaaN involved in tellurite resistance
MLVMMKENHHQMSDEKALHNSRTGFEDGLDDITREQLLKSYGEEFMNEMAQFADEVKAQVKRIQDRGVG